MINIALCDGSTVTQRLISCMLEKIRKIKNFTVTKIKSGEELLSDNESFTPDVILINDNFCISDNIYGTEAARLIRSRYSLSEIIFLTSSPYNTGFSFTEAREFTCISKPVLYEDIEKSILSTFEKIPESEEVSFRYAHSSFSVIPEEIIYLEADKRNTYIRTAEKSYVSTENISTVMGKLPENIFFRTHRTYALNFGHIAAADEDIITMDNGEYVILSRQRKKDFQSSFERYKKTTQR